MCQCPYSGFFHFYMIFESKFEVRKEVSMPLLGLLPFLQEKKPDRLYVNTVSMPLLGLLPFLPLGIDDNYYIYYLCQCPYSGFFHFYEKGGRCYEHRDNVSMPLLGLLPFLQINTKIFSMISDMCQCPYSGFFHFYLLLREN